MRLFFSASSCSSVHAQPNNPQPLGPNPFPSHTNSFLQGLKKTLSQDDNVAHVWIERPFWKLRGLTPRLFEHLCAWEIIHFSKAHDQSFLAWYDFPNVWKTVCSSKVPKGWQRRLRTKNPYSYTKILNFSEPKARNFVPESANNATDLAAAEPSEAESDPAQSEAEPAADEAGSDATEPKEDDSAADDDSSDDDDLDDDSVDGDDEDEEDDEDDEDEEDDEDDADDEDDEEDSEDGDDEEDSDDGDDETDSDDGDDEDDGEDSDDE